MIVSVRCPSCGEQSSISDPEFGRVVDCQCGRRLDASSSDDGSGETPGSGTRSDLDRIVEAPRSSVPGRIGRYRVVRQIAMGCFGKVFLAHDEDLDRPVAVKVPFPEVLQEPELRERFVKEARAVAKMRHQGIVTIYEIGTEGERCYIASEYLEGRTLKRVMADETIGLERSVRILVELAEALSHAHAARVVHRDVKPSNVMVLPDDRVKLIDFGLAHLETSTQTRDHAVMGTAAYMAPEQAAGDARRIGPASDQYSLGVIFYEFLCGRPPFEGESHSVLYRSVHTRIPAPSEVDPTVPPDLEAICLKALAKDPAGRYASCRVLAIALREWLQERLLVSAAASHPADPAPAGPTGLRVDAGRPGTLARRTTQVDEQLAARLTDRSSFRELVRLASERAGAEAEAEKALTDGLAAAEKEHEKRRKAIARRHEAERKALLESEGERCRSVVDKAAEARELARAEFDRVRAKILEEAEARIGSAKDAFQSEEWALLAVSEATETIDDEKSREVEVRVVAADMDLEALQAALVVVERTLGPLGLLVGPESPPESPPKASIRELQESLAEACLLLKRLDSLGVVGLLRWPGQLAIFVGAALMALYPAVATLGGRLGPVAAGMVGLTLVLLVRPRIRLAAAARINALYGPLRLAVSRAEALADACRARAARDSEARVGKVELERGKQVRRSRRRLARVVKQVEMLRDKRLRKVEAAYRALSEKIELSYDPATLEQQTSRRVERLALRVEGEARQADRRHRSRAEAIRAADREASEALAVRWRDGLAGVGSEVEAIGAEVGRLSPPWGDPAWDAWTPPDAVPPIVRFGAVSVGLDRLPDGLPRDPRLREGLPSELTWPALLHFPDRANLLIEAPRAGAEAAVRVLQAAAMRLLTSLPPGKVRLTIIDPAGLGRDFGAFMHLADYDEALISVKTEPLPIERCLADVSALMEKIIQRYLRNEFETIGAYNASAGEIAEPYRVLVVSGYPAGFDDSSCRRLARIAAHGSRCGIHVLAAVDSDRPLPPSPTIADLAEHSVHLAWKGGQLVWKDADFGPYPLTVDPPPPSEWATRILHVAGAAAEVARRVEVPFEFIAPPQDRWWTGDSGAGIEVGLGKAGPTKAQALVLGKGTSQHVLVAGRTGSGKSSLLNALITNTALIYSPDEAELYLVDFKKGVEFKTYASNELPHARVVAIESEREFGLSVLQRLDAEIEERADRFRDAGVQDIKGYRGIDGLPPLPRILLVVDEFQEFFVEDDKVAQEAMLLLDRLVRQGRAFGIHVILGTQTLSGAYSLARSTLGQMGVRIALQCSESDAHLILSEENPAARLLSRPGEAVYNDANGTAEGNHYFQVAWLPDDRREVYLHRIRELARRRGAIPARPQIVFEGNKPAALSENHLLRGRLVGPRAGAAPQAVQAWLGEAVAIKDPTAAVFRRQGGDNLLVLGQHEEAAMGVMASSLLSLAAHYPPSGPEAGGPAARLVILDGTADDSPRAGTLSRLAGATCLEVVVVDPRQAATSLVELAGEVARRLGPGAPGGPDIYLFLHDLARFRDLRRPDDLDFASTRQDASSPALALETILREGPALGIYVLAWCHNLVHLTRALGRQSLREFGQRILFQMSAADSSLVMDSPLAGRLGPHRALFYDEGQNRLEKFRPYGLPPEDWVDWARERFARREDLDPSGAG